MEMHIKSLCKSYGNTKALIDFSFNFGNGIYALLGPNGSGKSTLMNIITDNLKADSGIIIYNGTDISKLGAKYREKIGFMPQYAGMYPTFTANDFLSYIAVLKDVSKKDAKKQIDELLEAMELSDVKNRQIKTFSGGMKQRLALAQALIGEPELIILDEPTAGLDPKQRISIRNYISSISVNRTVIIATHIVSDVEFIAKEIIFLKKGIIAESGSPETIIKKAAGSVWEAAIAVSEVDDFKRNWQILNIHNDDNGVVLRILSEQKPSESALQVAPTLEDCYFKVFGDIL